MFASGPGLVAQADLARQSRGLRSHLVSKVGRGLEKLPAPDKPTLLAANWQQRSGFGRVPRWERVLLKSAPTCFKPRLAHACLKRVDSHCGRGDRGSPCPSSSSAWLSSSTSMTGPSGDGARGFPRTDGQPTPGISGLSTRRDRRPLPLTSSTAHPGLAGSIPRHRAARLVVSRGHQLALNGHTVFGPDGTTPRVTWDVAPPGGQVPPGSPCRG